MMTWNDDFHHSNGGGTESMGRRRTRRRRNYVPPHLRNSTAPPPHPHPRYSSTESTRFPRPSLGTSSPSYRGRGRGGGGGGGGGGRGGRGRGRSHVPTYSLNREQFDNYPHYNDVVEKFDELEVLDDDENDANGVINFDVYDDIPVDVTGSDVPAPVTSFDEVDLGAGLSENIKRCKYVKPTPVQKYAIPIAVAGRDLMACAQTGSGKTAAFCFPIISRILKGDGFQAYGRDGGPRMACPSALILSPTRELSCQIHDEAKKFAHNTGLKIVVAYGGAPIGQQFRNLERGVDILVATPGRLMDMIERVKVSLSTVRYLALDEADRMLDMGFEPQIRKIVQQMGMPPPGQRQTMLFSATFPHEIQRLASDFLSNYIFLTVGRVGSSTDLIAQRIELVQNMDKRSHLMHLLRTQSENGSHGKRALTLIFVETKRGADSLENWLSCNGFPAAAIHGDKVQMERERALKCFKSGATPILVATDVASRGLDIPHVSHVINFDLPKDIDSYVHRIGRTGRAGKSGHATAFFNDKNASLAKSLVELMKEAKQDVPSWLSQFAENSESSSYSGDAGRSKRYGSSNFGSYDYRSDAQYGNGSYYNSNHYNGGPYASSSGGYDYGDPTPVPYVSVSPGYYDPVVATGWD